MRITWKLAVASLKMFFRQREAILWSMLLPLFMVFLFGFVKFGGLGTIDLGVVNDAGADGDSLITRLQGVHSLRVLVGEREAELAKLSLGERDLVVVLPVGMNRPGAHEVTTFVNDARPQETQLGALVLQRVFDELSFAHMQDAERLLVRTQAVKSRNLTYIDFLLPGILSMSIMQSGIFGVAFGFVSLKKRGILRRLFVTPINPGDFIIAQVLMRLFVLILQVGLMIGAGILFFNLHFIGSLADVMLIGILGGIVFLAIGFALAGISRSEDQVAPLANIISLPMMLLSGVFFSRSNLPGFIHTITGFFPLTYLADGMRSIAIDGASLTQIGPQLIGLGIWCVVSCVIAIRMFRWE